MDTKECTSCGIVKPASEFYASKINHSGLVSWCRKCCCAYNKAHAKTRTGRIVRVYNGQCLSSKTRGHNPPAYTLDEFMAWSFGSDRFDMLYTAWSESGFKKSLTPSCDRLDDSKGYSFGNIQWLTWQENMEKGCSDQHEERKIGVEQLDPKTGNVVATYPSAVDAASATGICRVNIVAAMKGRHKKIGGYGWRYAEGDHSAARRFIKPEWR